MYWPDSNLYRSTSTAVISKQIRNSTHVDIMHSCGNFSERMLLHYRGWDRKLVISRESSDFIRIDISGTIVIPNSLKKRIKLTTRQSCTADLILENTFLSISDCCASSLRIDKHEMSQPHRQTVTYSDLFAELKCSPMQRQASRIILHRRAELQVQIRGEKKQHPDRYNAGI